jgi:integrase
MASIHKDPRGKSPFWYCAYTLPNGRRTFRSTKQRDRKKAFDVCRALERASEKAREGELTEIQVRKILGDILESVGPALRPETVRSYVQSWLASKKLSVTHPTHRHLEKALEEFLESLGPKADRSLSGVSSLDVAAFRDQHLTNISRGTLYAKLKIIRSLFTSARRQGLVLHNPAEAIELPTLKAIRRELFTPEELRALLAAASNEWKTLILLGYYLGGRLGDMRTLSWDSVDLANSVITFTQGKTGRQVQVPLHPELEEHLLSLAKDRGGALCPDLSKAELTGRSGLSSQFIALMAQAGIDPLPVRLARNKLCRKSFHCLRYSFTSALANAGVSAEMRMKLTGHQSFDIHQRYTRHELEPLKNAISALPRITEKHA